MPDIIGTEADETLLGGPGDDKIQGGGGADSLSGGAGNDTLDGQNGADTLSGGLGDDQLSAGYGDVAYGDDGNDHLSAGPSDGAVQGTTLDGGAGDDWIYLYNTTGQTVHASGGDGADTFSLDGPGPAVLDGGAGGDIFLFQDYQYSAADDVTITLGAGQDRLVTTTDMYAPPHVVVTDFTPGAGGDRIDLAGYLARATNWYTVAVNNPFTEGYVRLNQVGGDTDVDMKFAGDWRTLFVLQGVTPGQLTAENFEGYSPTGGARSGVLIPGTDGADSLWGSAGPDTISGGAGDDTINGSAGADQITGDDGADLLQVNGFGSPTFHGGAGDDRVDGYYADGGAYYGEAGNDSFSFTRSEMPVGVGIFDMGDGNDTLNYYGSGPASFDGGTGNDSLTITTWDQNASTNITINAGSGDDTLTISGSGHDIITLGDGADTLVLTSNYVVASTGGRGLVAEVTDFSPGEDHISMGFAGFRYGVMDGVAVVQGPGYFDADTWQTLLQLDGVNVTALGAAFTGQQPASGPWEFGTFGADTLTADATFTLLDGGDGNDLVTGGATADVLRGGYGNDTLSGGLGADSLDGGHGDDSVTAGAGDDVITDFGGSNYLRGDDGNDQITGGYQFDDINGNKGDDTIDGGSGGADWLVGGQGNDLITAHDSGNILYGNLGNDTLNGGYGNELIRGGQGDDMLSGGGGNDWMSGDRGSDTLTGGSGADTFHSFSGAGLDIVTDFNATFGDRVQLDTGTTYTLAQQGADVVVDMGSGDELILKNVTLTSLPAGWIFTL